MIGRRLVQVVLLFIAVQQAIAAVTSPIPQIHVGMLALALVLAVAVGRMKMRPSVKSAPVPRYRRLGQWMAVGGGVASVIWWRFAPWAPSADFDVTGILYVMQNAFPLFVMGALIAITAGGAGAWIQNR